MLLVDVREMGNSSHELNIENFSFRSSEYLDDIEAKGVSGINL